jgi:hypothetical protein
VDKRLLNSATTHVILLREDFLRICQRDHAAAMLLEFLSRWQAYLPDGEFITVTQAEVRQQLMGLFGERKIAEAYCALLKLGFLDARKNPFNPLDRTRQCRVNVDRVLAEIERTAPGV